MTANSHAPDDAQGGRVEHSTDTVDITPTPETCRQIARLFRAQRADAEALAVRAAEALNRLDTLDDDALVPWDRALLVAAFEALYEDERARVHHMDEGLEALGSYADDREGSADGP